MKNRTLFTLALLLFGSLALAQETAPAPLPYANSYNRAHEKPASRPYQTDMSYGVAEYRAWAETQPQEQRPLHQGRQGHDPNARHERNLEYRSPRPHLLDALGHCYELSNDDYGREIRSEVARTQCGFRE